jgi:lipopolysaccharide export LptBFGC system permease protein LptF
MIVLLHVAIALLSIVLAGYILVRPSRQGLVTSYVMMAATLGSGFYLVTIAPSHMIEACLMGVAYLAVVSVMTAASRVKLAHREAESSYIK